MTFVRPHSGQPGWARSAKAKNTGAGTATPIAVGDGGFCLDMGQAFTAGWQRGSTGLEVDATGSALTCDALTGLALQLNASL